MQKRNSFPLSTTDRFPHQFHIFAPRPSKPRFFSLKTLCNLFMISISIAIIAIFLNICRLEYQSLSLQLINLNEILIEKEKTLIQMKETQKKESYSIHKEIESLVNIMLLYTEKRQMLDEEKVNQAQTIETNLELLKSDLLFSVQNYLSAFYTEVVVKDLQKEQSKMDQSIKTMENFVLKLYEDQKPFEERFKVHNHASFLYDAKIIKFDTINMTWTTSSYLFKKSILHYFDQFLNVDLLIDSLNDFSLCYQGFGSKGVITIQLKEKQKIFGFSYEHRVDNKGDFDAMNAFQVFGLLDVLGGDPFERNNTEDAIGLNGYFLGSFYFTLGKMIGGIVENDGRKGGFWKFEGGNRVKQYYICSHKNCEEKRFRTIRFEYENYGEKEWTCLYSFFVISTNLFVPYAPYPLNYLNFMQSIKHLQFPIACLAKKSKFFEQNNAPSLKNNTISFIKPHEKKTHIPKKISFNGLNKQLLVNKFSYKLKSQVKLHILDERQLKYVNDMAFDKYSENAMKREQLKKKLMKEITDSILDPKTLSSLERIKLKFKFCLKSFLLNISKNLIILYKETISPLAKYLIKVQLPDGGFRIVFDIFCLIFIVWEIALIPLLLSFPEINDESINQIETTITSFFLFDIILNFNTGFYQRGNIVLKRGTIAKHYLKNWFIIDFIGSFPFDWIFQTNAEASENSSTTLLRILRFAKFLKLLRLLRALKLKKIFVKLEDYYQLSLTINAVLACVRLGFLMIFIAHWFACIWHMISTYESLNNPRNWLRYFDISDEEWQIRYVYSIYWAITTMVTVGYGDLTPTTPLEKVYAIFCMLLACGIFGYIMNRIGSIFSSFEENSAEYKIKVFQINQYMKKKNIPKSMQVKVRKYVQYTYDPDKKKQMDESAFFLCLSNNLQTELAQYMNGNILREFKLLSNILSKKLLNRLAMTFREHIYGPEEVIISEKEVLGEERYLYFLYKGIACSYIEECSIELEILNDGASFGEISFFTQCNCLASVKSLDFIYVYNLSRTEFLSIIDRERLKEDYETFHEIKDKIELNFDFKCLEISCYSCKNSDHLISKCPLIHFVPNCEEIVKKTSKKYTEFCKFFKRNQKRKHYNSIANFTLTQSSAFAIMNTLLIYKEEGLLEVSRFERIEFKLENDLDENQDYLGNSFENIQKFKEEKDFDKLIKINLSEDQIPLIPFLQMKKYSSEPQIILNNFSPRNKNLVGTPKTTKSINLKINQSFSEALIEKMNENEGTKEEIKAIVPIGTFNERIESFSIEKFENFSKYFPMYNFEEFKKKHNKCIEFRLKQQNTRKVSRKNSEIDAKIALSKLKTIKAKKNLNGETPFPLSARGLTKMDNDFNEEVNEKINRDIHEFEGNLRKISGNEVKDYDKILGDLDLEEIEEWIKKKKIK